MVTAVVARVVMAATIAVVALAVVAMGWMVITGSRLEVRARRDNRRRG